MEFKTVEVEDYQSGEIKIKYAIKNRTSLTPREYDSLLQLTMSIYIGDKKPLNTIQTIPERYLEIFTIEELIEREVHEMVRNMASFIFKEMKIADIFLRHIKAHKAMIQED